MNPELGGEEALRTLGDALASRRTGPVLDLVPNHMCIATPENRGWIDVLENGSSSTFAAFFEIDWSPPEKDDKVLLPIQGDQYGRVLEHGEIRVLREGGGFVARYYDHVLPLAPNGWTVVLEPVRDRFEAGRAPEAPDRVDLESILTAISHLPSRSEREPSRVQERQFVEDTSVLLLNASEHGITFHLPSHRPDLTWERVLDSGAAGWDRPGLLRFDRYPLRSRALAVLRVRPRATEASPA